MADADSKGSKVCRGCFVEKPVSEFGTRVARGKVIPRSKCKPCRNIENAEWRSKNPEKQRALVYAWAKRNPDRVREKTRRWREKNPEHATELARQWTASNRGRLRALWAKYRSDPVLRVHRAISQRLRVLLDGKNSQSTFDLLGYGRDELVAHLERQFLPGMGWHNYGKWHIDHIVPLSSFTISGTDDPEVRRAWNLTNLRPLWAEDNIRKRDKRTHLI